MSTVSREKALDRARALLSDRWAALARQPGRTRSGYLNLLDAELDSTGVAQNLMVTRLVPTIYERYWRPALGRVVKGVTGPGMAEEVRIARLLLGLGEDDTVLDLACGPGNFSREFARAVGPGGLVIGLDVSQTMLERGAMDTRRSGIENLAFLRADATALPFRDGVFDGACCFAALHLFAEPFAGLDEMTRVLRPGGRIALMTSVRRQLTLRPLKPLIERGSGMRVFEADEVTGALAERGFEGIHQRLAGVVQFVGGRLAG
ncbi:MAG: methyltransferase domain-containing protein [Solirubrobacterales bacterium]